MDYKLTDIASISTDPYELVQWMGAEGFLQYEDLKCAKCNSELVMNYSNKFFDGVTLRCTKVTCRSYLSVRNNSFFSGQRISLNKLLQMIVLFVSDATVTSCSRCVGVNRDSVTNFYQECRQKMKDELVQNPISFTSGLEYEVDEIYIRRIFDKTNKIFVNVWVGSILERDTGKIWLHILQDRTTNSIVPTIQRLVPKGSYVYSDYYPSYFRLKKLGYKHYAVNQSQKEFSREQKVRGGKTITVSINTLEGINTLIRNRVRYKSRRTFENLSNILSEITYRKSGRNLFEIFKIIKV